MNLMNMCTVMIIILMLNIFLQLKNTLLDTFLFFNGLMQRFPTIPIDAIDTIIKWMHNMTQFNNMPQSFDGLNSCINTLDRVLSIPYCSGCYTHIFKLNIDAMQECPRYGKEGCRRLNHNGRGHLFEPLSMFFYSPVHWKEMDYIIHNADFRNLVRQPLSQQTNNCNRIGSFVDTE